jgi:cell fate regulator YaaT (PSP1 superfamily)
MILHVLLEESPQVSKYIVNNISIELNDYVVVETERGITLGIVKKIEDGRDNSSPEIIRKAKKEDLSFLEKKEILQDKALIHCVRMIHEQKLSMKVVKVKYMLHGTKVIFYFTSESRVDFRSLVRKLASTLHARIEMRQIGVRDKAQMVGGIGICGREICCHTFIDSFAPVSLDDARRTKIASDKLIGVCGRFMCCLHFETDCETCGHKKSSKIDATPNEKSSYQKKSYQKKSYQKKDYQKKERKKERKKSYQKKDYQKKDTTMLNNKVESKNTSTLNHKKVESKNTSTTLNHKKVENKTKKKVYSYKKKNNLKNNQVDDNTNLNKKKDEPKTKKIYSYKKK